MATGNRAGADIYRYVDERGVVNFTDNPGNAGYEVYLRDGVSRPLLAIGYYPYRDEVQNASTVYKIEESLIRAVMEVESDYNRFAVSSTGARGLMQLMPATMRYLGVRNPYDPRQNIMGGTRYLKSLMGRFSGNLSLALAAYNAGAGNVVKYGRIPPFPQTRRYVTKVMARYRTYSGISE
ncbi:MAG: lytic transglycosylase domain-containing protein [Deltaproteobacteria bacterium]|nr:lytic transglycosylase domain-containing protein [Deltaproteobacteria bacterium]